MDFNKSFAIVVSIGIIMFFGMFWILSISNAWINTPTNYSFNINIDNETKEAIQSAYGQKYSIWSEQNKCDLILEQAVACYQGCHFMSSQGFVFNEQHEQCIEYCEKRYYTEVEGNTYFKCEYRGGFDE